jgi:hypothetical protein
MHREPYRYIQSSLDADGWLLQNWELCSELGIRRVIPFVTRTMIELACSVHPSDHAFPIKRLLRLGLRDDVPEANLMRTDKGPTWSEDFFDETEVSPVVHCVLADRTIEQLEQQKGQLRVETGLAYSLKLLSVSLEGVTKTKT